MENEELLKNLRDWWKGYFVGRRQSIASFAVFLALADTYGAGTQAISKLLFEYKDDFQGFVKALCQGNAFSRENWQNLLIELGQFPTPARKQLIVDAVENMPNVLTEFDLAKWHHDGYVVVKQAIGKHQAQQVADLAFSLWGIDGNDPGTWCNAPYARIMQECYDHPLLDIARSSLRVHKAFSQLWGTADIWCSRDRTSINLPEQTGKPFPGPGLHLDVSHALPPYFSVQGILYLTDTLPEQGALTLVPGFHRQFSSWRATLPEGHEPGETDFYAMQHKPIGAGAGDLVIWHHWLPHGSSPNKANKPRVAQYIKMYPLRERELYTRLVNG